MATKLPATWLATDDYWPNFNQPVSQLFDWTFDSPHVCCHILIAFFKKYILSTVGTAVRWSSLHDPPQDWSPFSPISSSLQGGSDTLRPIGVQLWIRAAQKMSGHSQRGKGTHFMYISIMTKWMGVSNGRSQNWIWVYWNIIWTSCHSRYVGRENTTQPPPQSWHARYRHRVESADENGANTNKAIVDHVLRTLGNERLSSLRFFFLF